MAWRFHFPIRKCDFKSSGTRAQKRNKTKSLIIFKSRRNTGVIISVRGRRLFKVEKQFCTKITCTDVNDITGAEDWRHHGWNYLQIWNEIKLEQRTDRNRSPGAGLEEGVLDGANVVSCGPLKSHQIRFGSVVFQLCSPPLKNWGLGSGWGYWAGTLSLVKRSQFREVKSGSVKRVRASCWDMLIRLESRHNDCQPAHMHACIHTPARPLPSCPHAHTHARTLPHISSYTYILVLL